MKLFYENSSVSNEGGGDQGLVGGASPYLFAYELHLKSSFQMKTKILGYLAMTVATRWQVQKSDLSPIIGGQFLPGK